MQLNLKDLINQQLLGKTLIDCDFVEKTLDGKIDYEYYKSIGLEAPQLNSKIESRP